VKGVLYAEDDFLVQHYLQKLRAGADGAIINRAACRNRRFAKMAMLVWVKITATIT
jgi:hypothetical protein